MLVEVIVIAIFLGVAAIGITYFFTQTKITMSSSSQVMKCQTIVKQALENVVSLGTRLYGYKIKHDTSNLNYTPLFITKNTKAYGVDDNGFVAQTCVEELWQASFIGPRQPPCLVFLLLCDFIIE